MTTTTRTLALLGAAGAAAGPAALALAEAPSRPAPTAAPLRAPLAGEPTLRAQMRDHLHEALVARYTRLAEKVDRDATAARTWSNGRLAGEIAAARATLRERRESATVAIPAHLAAIARCESGGNPRAIGGGGTYRGMFQFSVATWSAVGGSGDPAAASVAEQVKRAEILYSTAGAGQWPVCGA